MILLKIECSLKPHNRRNLITGIIFNTTIWGDHHSAEADCPLSRVREFESSVVRKFSERIS